MKNIVELKLREIDRILELSKSEGGPVGKERERLNSKRRKLLAMLKGGDLRYSITGKVNYIGGLTVEQRKMGSIKRICQQIMSIL